ncbi:hypothetical protein [Dysosmobacter sp.]
MIRTMCIRKQIAGLIIIAFMIGLVGCGGNTAGTSETAGLELPPTEELRCGFISSDIFSEDISDEIRKDWLSYEALNRQQQMTYCKIPGNCQKDFDDWAECEKSIGVNMENPLENCVWLEKGTYLGMPEGYLGTPAVRVTWHGTKDGSVNWLRAESGYRSGDIRVVLSVMLYKEAPEEETEAVQKGDVRNTEQARLYFLENLEDDEPVLTESHGEKYVSSTAYFPWEYGLYCIDVVGTAGEEPSVRETLEQILGCFSDNSDF